MSTGRVPWSHTIGGLLFGVVLFMLGLVLGLLSTGTDPCPPFVEERAAVVSVLNPTEEDIEWLEECGFTREESER